MNEVTTSGRKKFYCRCSNCNCYFSYEPEDLYIYCPDCSERNYHQSFSDKQIELDDHSETGSPSYSSDNIKLY